MTTAQQQPPTERKRFRVFSVISCVALIAVTLICWRQYAEIRRLRVDVTAQKADIAGFRRAVAKYARDLSSAQRTKAVAEMQLVDTKLRNKPASASSDQVRPSSDDSASEAYRKNRLLKQDPSYAPFWHTQQRRMILKEYGALIASLHLPADKAENLKELLIARSDSLSDAGEIGRQAGLGPEGIRAALKDATTDYNTQIETLLGSGTYDDFRKNLAATSVFGSQMENLAVGLADSGEPITPTQQLQLARMLFDAANNPSATPGDVNNSFINDASRLLSPAQLAALKSFRAEEAQRSELAKVITRKDPSP
jgi:hypothetical protein